MQQINRQGIVIYEDGDMVENSFFSALALERIVRHSVLIPVPEVDGLFYRLALGEDKTLSDEQRESIHERATAWKQSRELAEPVAETPDQSGTPPKPTRKGGAKGDPAEQPTDSTAKAD